MHTNVDWQITRMICSRALILHVFQVSKSQRQAGLERERRTEGGEALRLPLLD